MTLIGYGGAITPGTPETHWQVTGTDPNFTWTEDPGGNFHGYKANTSGIKMWGTNIIEDDLDFDPMEMPDNHTHNANTGSGDTISFITQFDDDLTVGDATDSETHAQGGDSGSSVFQKVGSEWMLVGITHAIAYFEDQPNPTGTAIYGNWTLSADLASYGHQILTITSVPEMGSFWLLSCLAAIVAAQAVYFARENEGICRINPTP